MDNIKTPDGLKQTGLEAMVGNQFAMSGILNLIKSILQYKLFYKLTMRGIEFSCADWDTKIVGGSKINYSKIASGDFTEIDTCVNNIIKSMEEKIKTIDGKWTIASDKLESFTAMDSETGDNLIRVDMSIKI